MLFNDSNETGKAHSHMPPQEEQNSNKHNIILNNLFISHFNIPCSADGIKNLSKPSYTHAVKERNVTLSNILVLYIIFLKAFINNEQMVMAT